MPRKPHLKKIKKLLDEGWEDRRAARRAASQRNSQFTKKWKLEQKKKEERIEMMLQKVSVRDFLKNKK